MQALTSLKQLRDLQGHLTDSHDPRVPTIVIPAGTCGRASGATELIRVAEERIGAAQRKDEIRLRVTGCHGFCEMEPSVLVEPDGVFYGKVDADKMAGIIEAALRGEVLNESLFRDPATDTFIPAQADIPFFRKQVRAILSGSEKVDPTCVESYLRNKGYSALAKVLEMGNAPWVVEEVKASGLRGRGGAGFPTGIKWGLLAAQPSDGGKFVVCNADEGDPGAYMDRSVLEGNPHSVIEGMIIGAYGTGATRGIVYVRNEYPLAISHLTVALSQAREYGLLGDNILGAGFSFDIDLIRGAGAFVCGEETALIHAIEGRMGEPRQRPPFPIDKGIEGKPTAINNVETWANIPIIIENGGKAFAKIGREGNSGTKLFSLVGKIQNTGLIEVPMGITIKEVIDDIGGGPAGKARIKAVQTGGPSGGCIPADRFDLHIDYDSLAEAGSIMGSGGMIVMDEDTCMVDVAKYFMKFLKDESCGKCFTCRKGTQRLHEILDDISNGIGTADQLDLLEDLSYAVKDTAMCGLGQTAPNPVLSTLQYFRDEYLEHIENKRCPAGVCKTLITYSINDSCVGCQACAGVCPSDAITGEKKDRHTIDRAKCIKCGLCRSVCKFEAVDVT